MSPRPAAPSSASVTACSTDVGVAVADQAARVRDAHAAEDQRPALGQPVRVVADADAKGHRANSVEGVAGEPREL